MICSLCKEQVGAEGPTGSKEGQKAKEGASEGSTLGLHVKVH